MFELLNQDLFGTTLLNWLLVIAAAAAITALVRLVELQAILVEAEKVGHGIASTLAFDTRVEGSKTYEDRNWEGGTVTPRLLVVSLLVVVASFGGPQTAAGDKSDDAGPFARGFGYVGAFWVTESNTEARLFSTDLPLGTRLNVQKDLGVRDSFTVPRISLGWRFGKRHILTGGYYDLSRDGLRRLERTIELPGDIEFPVGVEVATSFTLRVSKLQYTYLFHRDEKVTLGIGAGLFVSKLGAGLTITGNVGPFQESATAFDESVTAPLPVFGFRLTYRVTRKLGVLASSDWFLLNYNNQYEGVLSDTQLYVAHRTFKHVGFAGGLNIQTFNVEFEDDDLLWQLDARLVGFLAAVTFYF